MGRKNRTVRLAIALGVCLLLAVEGGCRGRPLRRALGHYGGGGAPGGCALLPGGSAGAGVGYYCHPRFFPVPSSPVYLPPIGDGLVSESPPLGSPSLPVVPGPPMTEVPDASSWIFPRKQTDGPVLVEGNPMRAIAPGGLRTAGKGRDLGI